MANFVSSMKMVEMHLRLRVCLDIWECAAYITMLNQAVFHFICQQNAAYTFA